MILAKNDAVQNAIRNAAVLAAFTVVCAFLLSMVQTQTRPLIEAALHAKKMRAIREILPLGIYDNELLGDVVQFKDTAVSDTAMTVYRGRKNGKRAVLVIETQATGGYGGNIGLLIGVLADGTLTGVRVTGHRETPGLGDYIDSKPGGNNRWIRQFDGRSLRNPPERDWKVRKDGGRFDSIAGATVSPRAVVKAVRGVLKIVEERHDALYALSGNLMGGSSP